MRKLFLATSIIVIALVIIARLSYLQLFDEDISNNFMDDIAIEAKYTYPERGYIYDRTGKLLVSNAPAYDIMVIPNKMRDIDTLKFCELMDIPREEFDKKINKAKVYSPRLPSVFMPQLSKKEYAAIQERMYKYPGFYVQKRMLRDYQTHSGANVLGYISEVNDWEAKNKIGYQPGELIGRSGVETVYENDLRGKKGVKFIQKDIYNRILGSYKDGRYDTLPVQGKDIQITIDDELESYGEALMANKRGGIVAIEPSSGEILALVTAPNFDPDLLVGRKRSKNFTKFYNDSIAKPLYDRGLLAQYPPGSPFKTIMALIGLQEGVITPDTKVTCYHGYHYGRKGFMGCHCGPSGTVNDLNRAIYKSCNSYFSDTYRRVIQKYPTSKEGVDAWSKHVKSFGLGDYLHNDLATGRKGYIPDGSTYDRWYGENHWFYTNNISNAIGQGEILTTPIQLANVAAIIANRGFYYTPHIVKSVNDQPLEDPQYTKPKYTTIDKEYFEPVIQGMYDVYRKGTAARAQVDSIHIGGKTGTSQNSTTIGGIKYDLADHSIFIAIAPIENPKIALAVFVENGVWGSRYAAPIASLMIEKYIKGHITRTDLERRMFETGLQDEYDKILHPELLTPHNK
ncbi:penicillin-binding protein 2 [Pustulibacterium marinum]|uniref:Penicillin-binding protein 2 n=1 Tax=Pustulibacterium marinum TaxID=1224947 RepID=A0A1I7EV49_9FLAO|nr:penicillin-binding protein 2 [Pustulibacterium marinum]SFU27814.1 penicillin-binding protein 2 [Pustulibacterium marinum]